LTRRTSSKAIDVERVLSDELRAKDRREVVAAHDRVGAFTVSGDALIGFDLHEHAPLRTRGERRRDFGDLEVARLRRDRLRRHGMLDAAAEGDEHPRRTANARLLEKRSP
jgi:hypothetical protein